MICFGVLNLDDLDLDAGGLMIAGTGFSCC